MKPWTKRELLTYLDRVKTALETSDHFQLLDVSPDADGDTIQAAFHTMAAGLHPDRHRNTLNGEQHERLIMAYARIAEAYRVLRNPEHRENYLRGVARAQSESDVSAEPGLQDPEHALALLSPKAQQLYRRAMAAVRTGDMHSATLNLKMALSKHPQSGFLRAALDDLRQS